ncbi:hypothetical protein BBOV_II005185 [Babesia bovis T2Bo]|uniref:hypothetical protein n=1 Tax=Babesia bovis T2Bo TaxID=484906 RepID=UPI001C34FE53|nr:hypothetical protein BBOV_II005185 [Babesia bovis T2Bo]KAG6440109.1 hypothetical protein BBOV_II005185 [Babesia bovis T2Bo]
MQDSTFMAMCNTADIMRWWIALGIKPRQEYTAFLNMKPTDMVKQIDEVRRQAALQMGNIDSRAMNSFNRHEWITKLARTKRVITNIDGETSSTS